MPHVIVKLASGRTKEQKATLALRLTQAIREVTDSSEDDISVAVEDVLVADWVEKVYVPEIQGRPELIYKSLVTIRSNSRLSAQILELAWDV